VGRAGTGDVAVDLALAIRRPEERDLPPPAGLGVQFAESFIAQLVEISRGLDDSPAQCTLGSLSRLMSGVKTIRRTRCGETGAVGSMTMSASLELLRRR